VGTAVVIVVRVPRRVQRPGVPEDDPLILEEVPVVVDADVRAAATLPRRGDEQELLGFVKIFWRHVLKSKRLRTSCSRDPACGGSGGARQPVARRPHRSRSGISYD
jgi:hypothetical protein